VIDCFVLKDIVEYIKTGKTPPTKEVKYFNGAVQWFTPCDLDKNKYLDKSSRTITKKAFDDKKAVIYPKDSLLVACIGDVGKIGITTEICSSNQQLTAIKPKDNVDVSFLYYWFKSNKSILQHMANNAVVPILNNKKLGQLKIPLPPLPEQKKIAAILDAADQLKQKDQQLIEHYNRLSQSLFLDMFGDPVTNPMGWKVSPADNYIDLLTGFAFKSKGYSNNKKDMHLCGGLIITPDGIDWSKANFWKLKDIIGLEKYEVCEGDIVMAMDRPWISSGFKIHQITKGDKKSLLVQRTARIRGKGINQDVLYYLFNQQAFEKHAVTTETTVPHISPKDIRGYKLIVPPITLQNQFAERIKAIEAQKQQAQLNLKKSTELFNSLLQRAFLNP